MSDDTVSLKEFVQIQIDALSKKIDTMNDVSNVTSKLLETRMDRMDGKITTIESKAAGRGESWAFVVGAGGLATGILIAVASYIR